MHCSACEKPLHPRGINYKRIQTETEEYTTCIDCLKIAQKNLRHMKKKTPEMKDLLRILDRVLLVN